MNSKSKPKFNYIDYFTNNKETISLDIHTTTRSLKEKSTNSDLKSPIILNHRKSKSSMNNQNKSKINFFSKVSLLDNNQASGILSPFASGKFIRDFKDIKNSNFDEVKNVQSREYIKYHTEPKDDSQNNSKMDHHKENCKENNITTPIRKVESRMILRQLDRQGGSKYIKIIHAEQNSLDLIRNIKNNNIKYIPVFNTKNTKKRQNLNQYVDLLNSKQNCIYGGRKELNKMIKKSFKLWKGEADYDLEKYRYSNTKLRHNKQKRSNPNSTQNSWMNKSTRNQDFNRTFTNMGSRQDTYQTFVNYDTNDENKIDLFENQDEENNNEVDHLNERTVEEASHDHDTSYKKLKPNYSRLVINISEKEL